MISGNFQFQQNTSCRHTDRDKNVAPLTLWSAAVIRQNPSSELLQHPIALARDKRSAIVQNELFILPESDLNDFSAHTNVLIVGLLCTTRKGLSTSIVLWIKIPSVVKLVTAVKLESQSTRRSPLPGATRSYPELPWFPRWGYPVGIWKPTWAAGVATSAATWQVGEHPGPPKRDETR